MVFVVRVRLASSPAEADQPLLPPGDHRVPPHRIPLTEHWDGQLIAVIVSGFDGDGAAALCGIKAVGGITIAQAPDTAGQPDMPESAIASGCIDFILSPEAIAREIIRIAKSH